MEEQSPPTLSSSDMQQGVELAENRSGSATDSSTNSTCTTGENTPTPPPAETTEHFPIVPPRKSSEIFFRKASLFKDAEEKESPKGKQKAEEYERINRERLSSSLRDAGEHSHGVVAIEAWCLNDDNTLLIRQDGCYWRQPGYSPHYFERSPESLKAALSRLENPEDDSFEEASPLAPGLGIAGQLWVEESTKNMVRTPGISAFGSRDETGIPKLKGTFSKSFRETVAKFNTSASLSFRKSIANFNHMLLHIGLGYDNSGPRDQHCWRDLKFLGLDPDHITDPRILLFLEAGIGQVAGLPFDTYGFRGVVLVFAETAMDRSILNDESNAIFLRRAADHIGTILAMSKPRIASLTSKSSAYVRRKSSLELVLPVDEEALLDEKKEQLQCENEIPLVFSVEGKSSKRKGLCQYILSMVYMVVKKSLGAKNINPPPAMPASECAYTFIGSVITLLLITRFSYDLSTWKKDGVTFAFPLGPVGALVSLQYSLTAAPASQPRNVIFGTTVSGSIALLFTYVPPEILPLWIRIALAPSLSITVMAMLGITHPPGNALAVIFSSGDYHWGHLFMSLIGCSISIALATLLNNLSVKRQYPQYWQFFR